MAKIIDPPRPSRPPRRGAAQEFKSQLALELALNALAIVGAAIIARCFVLTLSLDERLWLGSTLIQRTDIVVTPFSIVPGSDFRLLGNLSLVDATLLAIVFLIPIGFLARPARGQQPI